MTHDKAGLISALASGLVAVAATLAIVATYPRLSHTWDEGVHIEAGLELLQDGRYTLQTENPPLARVALALIPFWRGARVSPTSQSLQLFDADVFYRTPNYVANVTEARVLNLLFFWLVVGFTWALAGGRKDPWVAFVAAAAVAALPPVVAHSGFATTDVPFMAAFLGATLAFRRWLNRPGIGSAAWFGIAVGLALATKFSALVFLPPVVAATGLLHYWPLRKSWRAAICSAPLWLHVAAATTAALFVLWGCYRFDVGRLADLPSSFGVYGPMWNVGWMETVRHWRVPAPELVHGLLYLRAHAAAGHSVMLLDDFSTRGFWLFYPIVLLTKTPIPFLLLVCCGVWRLTRRRLTPRDSWFVGLTIGAFGMLLAAMTSPINMGVRHVLGVYPLLAAAAAYGVIRWAETSRWRITILLASVGCLALQLGLLANSVPNQVAYFSLVAGRDPAFVASDSDFDWGQDVLALEQFVAGREIPELYVQINGTAHLCRHALPPLKALPLHPVRGWVAVSERIYRLNRGRIRGEACGVPNTLATRVGWLDWLKTHEPVAIVGKTIRVYYIE